MDKLELSKNGSICIDDNNIIEIKYKNEYQVPISEIRNIEIINGILVNKIMIIETDNLKLEINLLMYNLDEITEFVNFIRSKLNRLEIKCVIEKNGITDRVNLSVFSKNNRLNRIIRYIISFSLLFFIAFGGLLVKMVTENNNIKLYSNNAIENKVERIFENYVGKDVTVQLQENSIADDIGIIALTSLYSSEDYPNIYRFIIETDKLKTNYVGFIYKLNDQYIDTIGYSLEIDDNIVWIDNNDSQNSINYNPNNTYGEIIEIKNEYGRPLGYRIKEYFIGTEIIVEDKAIEHGYDYEYKFKIGNFVEVYGNKVNNNYISNAYVNLFPKEIMENIGGKNKE